MPSRLALPAMSSRRSGGVDLIAAIRTVASGRSLLDRSTTTRVLDRLRESEQHGRRLELRTTRASAVPRATGDHSPERSGVLRCGPAVLRHPGEQLGVRTPG